MTLSLASLLRPRPRTEVRDGLLAALGAAGFPVTSWRSGGTARTLVEVIATGVTEAWTLAATVTRGMLLDLSEGDWLTALAWSHYRIERASATWTVGYVRLTALAGVGPYVIPAAGLVVSDGTRFYRSTHGAALTLAAGGTLDVPVRAESPGASYNVPALSALVSPALPGVTLTSPAYGSGSTWRTADGRDTETDRDLRDRCTARWSTLGRGATLDAYRYLATTCPTAPGVTRAAVVTGPGDGTVYVYLATSSGAASGGEASAVAAWLDLLKPATDTVTVAPATAVAVAIVATVRTRDTSGTNLARITDALGALQARLGIGDDVDLGALYTACYAALDVVDVSVTAPTGDTVIAPSSIATLTWTVTLEAP